MTLLKETTYKELLREQFNDQIDFREKRPGIEQLIVPLFHEDGDMVDIFLEVSKTDPGKIRICDHALTLMRLSYTFDINTPNKERIFQQILDENQINEDDGNLYLEVEPERLYPSILHFAQTMAKVSNMQLYKREVIHSLFMEYLTEFIETSLKKFNPTPNVFPIKQRDDLEVDFLFDIKPRPVYLFGVKDNRSSRLVTISCLEFQKAQLPFRSYVVHEDFWSLSRKDISRITNAVDKQFTTLDCFKEDAIQTFEREVA